MSHSQLMWLAVQDNGLVSFGSPLRCIVNEHINDCYDETLGSGYPVVPFERLRLTHAVIEPHCLQNSEGSVYTIDKQPLIGGVETLINYKQKHGITDYEITKCKTCLSGY